MKISAIAYMEFDMHDWFDKDTKKTVRDNLLLEIKSNIKKCLDKDLLPSELRIDIQEQEPEV